MEELSCLQTWYVYMLCDPDTEEPFYVGKGTGNRMYQHEYLYDTDNNEEKKDIIRDIHSRGKEVLKKKIAEFEDEIDAYIYEWGVITMLAESLTNMKYGTHCLVGREPKKPEARIFKTMEDYIRRYDAITEQEVMDKFGLSTEQLNVLAKKFWVESVAPGWRLSHGNITYSGFTKVLYCQESVAKITRAIKNFGADAYLPDKTRKQCLFEEYPDMEHNLRSIRESLNASRETLAYMADGELCVSTIRNAERKKCRLTFGKAQQILNAINKLLAEDNRSPVTMDDLDIKLY